MRRKKIAQTPSLVRDASGDYIATRWLLSEAEILTTAEAIIEQRFYRLAKITRVDDAIAFLRAKLALQEHEVFSCLLLDQKHRVLAWEVIFHGTIDGCSVHPRVVVQRALAHQAAAVIFAHPHPSGVAEPSQADIEITQRLRDALALIDVRVLDHIVIGGMETVSLSRRGLI